MNFTRRKVSTLVGATFLAPYCPALAYAKDGKESAFLCATAKPKISSGLDPQSADGEAANLEEGETAPRFEELGLQGVAHSSLRWRPSMGLPSHSGHIRLGIGFAENPSEGWKNQVIERAMRWIPDGSALSKKISFEFLSDPKGAQIIVGRGGTGTRPIVNKSKVGRAALNGPLKEDNLSTMIITDISSTEHEFGHALCLGHEHKHKAIPVKIDAQKAVAFFKRKFGWDTQRTIDNVLTSAPSCSGDPTFNPSSVMIYPLPPEILDEPNIEFYRYFKIHRRDRKCVEDIYGA